jgi:hypothetical protein
MVEGVDWAGAASATAEHVDPQRYPTEDVIGSARFGSRRARLSKCSATIAGDL